MLIELNYKDKKPIYIQIVERYKKLIVSGVLNEDEKLPSVRALASQLTTNPNTVQKAYRELERAGYIYSIAGKGNFVGRVEDRDEEQVKAMKKKLFKYLLEAKEIGIKDYEVQQWVSEVFE